tara:strand:+ start:85 stop:282 length:198 start_codon:yes stop_codon:yes gene_type:complete
MPDRYNAGGTIDTSKDPSKYSLFFVFKYLRMSMKKRPFIEIRIQLFQNSTEELDIKVDVERTANA